MNLEHLNRLSREVVVDGVPMLLVGIYADAPDYRVVGDADEGVACVDDVARAAQVYLRHFRITKDRESLRRARLCLNFVMYMQAKDGRFYNFVTDWSGTINRSGHTSYPDIGWWGGRAMHALAESLRVFRNRDARFAAKIEAAYLRAERAFARQKPERTAADWPALVVLAMAEYLRIRRSTRTLRLLARTATQLTHAPVGGSRRHAAAGDLPVQRISQWKPAASTWHSWGAHTAQALAVAGRILRRRDLIEHATREVEGIFGWQLAAGRIQDLLPLPSADGQQAYGVSAAAHGALELARATGNRTYATMAGLHAAWFSGSNMARTPMYDPRTGRGFDGIDGPAPKHVNRSSGAESTIEALLTMLALVGNTDARRAARMRATARNGWQVVEAERARTIAGAPRILGERTRDAFAPGTDSSRASNKRFVELCPGDVVALRVTGTAAGMLPFISAHVRGAGRLQVRIDGGKWQDVGTGRRSRHPFLRRPAGAVLGSGRHTIELRVVGARRRAVAHVDGILLHPVRAQTVWASRQGARLVASYDATAGRLELQ